MKYINEVIIQGILGRDPDLRYTPSGKALATFSVATNRYSKAKDATDWKESTEWHSIVAWDKLAEEVCRQLQKGSGVRVEGYISTRCWETKGDLTKHYKTEIIAQSVIPIARSEGIK